MKALLFVFALSLTSFADVDASQSLNTDCHKKFDSSMKEKEAQEVSETDLDKKEAIQS